MNDEIKPKFKWAGISVRDGVPWVHIYFPYSLIDLDRVRTLPNRKYNSEGKFWVVPYESAVIDTLRGWGWQIGPGLEELYQSRKQRLEQFTDTPIAIPGLLGELFPFQNIGVSFIEAHDGRVLLADDMGLGKTIQALAWLQLHRERIPVVIVVPASLKLNWVKEIHAWLPSASTQVLSGTKPEPIVGEFIIVNYDVLHAWIETIKKINPQVLITDECHYYKSNSAKRTKAVKRLAKGIRHVIAISGTPIVNRPVEAYNAIKLVDAAVVPSFWEFAQRYCGARHNGFGWDFTGSTNTRELHERLTSTIMLRRRKEDVLKDLPNKMRSFVPIELDNEYEYQHAEANFVAWVQNNKGEAAAIKMMNAEALARIEILKQLAVKGKLRQATEWIENFLEVDGKLVVFCTHKFVVDHLMERFKNVAVKIDGSVSMTERQRAVDRFQNDETVRLFVGNIQAAGVGITLTASSNVAFLELPWTPGALTQAEDRVHRIGQVDSVAIHFLLATGTIEERIARLIDKKRKVLDSVLDGQDTDESSLLGELMGEFV